GVDLATLLRQERLGGASNGLAVVNDQDLQPCQSGLLATCNVLHRLPRRHAPFMHSPSTQLMCLGRLVADTGRRAGVLTYWFVARHWPHFYSMKPVTWCISRRDPCRKVLA